MDIIRQLRLEDLQDQETLTPAELQEYIRLCEAKEREVDARRATVDWYEVM